MPIPHPATPASVDPAAPQTRWADGFLDARWKDGRISVKELAAYVRDKVDRWAVQNTEARQTPMLLGTGKNFSLRAFADKLHVFASTLGAFHRRPSRLAAIMAKQTLHTAMVSHRDAARRALERKSAVAAQ